MTKLDITATNALFKDRDDRELYSGLIRLHILYHATCEPIFGLGMIEELGRHGYKLSPGTLYPLLHGLERRGYLRSSEKRTGRQFRRLYRATAKGREALEAAKEKVHELFAEIFEERPMRRMTLGKKGIGRG
jgi:DNA-binding PadR family transcriptional regulator